MNLAMANAGVPSSKLFELLKIQRTTSHSPLFQVLVNYRLGALEQVEMGDCELTDMKGNPPKTPYDLTALIIEKSQGECLLQFDVQKYLYSDEDSLQLLRCYSHLLETLSQASDACVGDCEMFSPAMRNESLRYAMGTVPLDLDDSTSLLSLINAHFQTSSARYRNDRWTWYEHVIWRRSEEGGKHYVKDENRRRETIGASRSLV